MTVLLAVAAVGEILATISYAHGKSEETWKWFMSVATLNAVLAIYFKVVS